MVDTKDWTWVLERRCADCEFEAGALQRNEIGDLIRTMSGQWEHVLGRGEVTRVRPQPEVWSAAEYGCHVRDVFVLFLERLELMLNEDGAAFANWDQDATAIADRYSEQDPGVVVGELTSAAAHLADAFDAVGADDWARTGERSDGSHFTVESFGRYLCHDPYHHLWDVERGFETIASAT